MSYTSVWKNDRKVASALICNLMNVSGLTINLSFLIFVSPTAPIPALTLLLARRGHRSLVLRETEKPPRENLPRHS